MTIRTYIKSTLLASLVSLAIGGFLLHLRVHPFTEHSSKLVPFVSGVLSIVIVPLLFCFKKTGGYGYVLNGMLAILGTVTMAHFGIAHWPKPASFGAILLKTTLPDIALLWGKFLVGKALFDLDIHGYNADRQKMGITYRYPNYGWWIAHLAVISLVYFLGHELWR
jgi:hypothetical protein